MKQKFYLVYVLIEYSPESITDSHRLCSSLDKAKEAMAKEIEEAKENFLDDDGESIIDTERCQEWRNEDGYGYTIGIEEMTAE